MSAKLSRLSDSFVLRFATDLYHCSSCNYCVDAVWPERGLNDACVTMAHHSRAPGYSGRGFIEAARAVLEGMPLDAGRLAERVFTCTSCGNCESACPIGLRPASIGEALRAELVETKSLPQPIAHARHAVLTQANPYGAEKAARTTWAADLAAAADATGPIYFVGCAAALKLPEEARAGYELLRRAGLSPQIATTGCCGAPLAAYGDPANGDALASACAASLDAAERTVIVAGYDCARQLEPLREAPVLSVAAWLLGAVRDGTITLTRNDDPHPPPAVHLLEACALKRRTPAAPATDENAVRELFATLDITCRDPLYPSPHAPCCGAGGGMDLMQPEASRRMAAARIPDAGIAVILDPRCAAHLREAAADKPATVLGFAEFMLRYFTLEASPADTRHP
jgi:Fe-S oxidoreductase